MDGSRGASREHRVLDGAFGGMGCEIPVTSLTGGPDAVYLLDAFNAAPDVSNW